jgi:segregation and condensation protein B|tara:strand:+ start:2382 stop:2975 length:594 start_codon:yes stop_codon:yes gene_type:complete
VSNVQDKYKNNLDYNLKQKIIEAVIFQSADPINFKALEKYVSDKEVLDDILFILKEKYNTSGVNLININNSYAFRTSYEVAEFLNIEKLIPKPLSRAATETLSIIAYHQPITRSEIEDIRGVSLSKGTLDLLWELSWIKPGQRRATPGRPLTWVTTNFFLDHFGLKNVSDLPGIDDLKNSGLLEKNNILFNDNIDDE